MSDLTADTLFNEEDGLRLDGLDVFVDEGRKSVRLEDDVYFFKLYVEEAIALRDWLNKVIP